MNSAIFQWSSVADTMDNLPDKEFYKNAALLLGKSLEDTQRMTTREKLQQLIAPRIADLFNAPVCQNEDETVLGDPITSVPPYLLYTVSVGGRDYCYYLNDLIKEMATNQKADHYRRFKFTDIDPRTNTTFADSLRNRLKYLSQILTAGALSNDNDILPIGKIDTNLLSLATNVIQTIPYSPIAPDALVNMSAAALLDLIRKNRELSGKFTIDFARHVVDLSKEKEYVKVHAFLLEFLSTVEDGYILGEDLYKNIRNYALLHGQVAYEASLRTEFSQVEIALFTTSFAKAGLDVLSYYYKKYAANDLFYKNAPIVNLAAFHEILPLSLFTELMREYFVRERNELSKLSEMYALNMFNLFRGGEEVSLDEAGDADEDTLQEIDDEYAEEKAEDDVGKDSQGYDEKLWQKWHDVAERTLGDLDVDDLARRYGKLYGPDFSYIVQMSSSLNQVKRLIAPHLEDVNLKGNKKCVYEKLNYELEEYDRLPMYQIITIRVNGRNFCYDLFDLAKQVDNLSEDYKHRIRFSDRDPTNPSKTYAQTIRARADYVSALLNDLKLRRADRESIVRE